MTSDMDKKIKHVEITIVREDRRGESYGGSELKASINLGSKTTFAQIERFLEDFKDVIQDYKHCVKNGIFCKVYLSSGIYQIDSVGGLKTRAFSGWMTNGVPMAGDIEGLYLSPDLRYTDEGYDIYIDFTKPLLSQLAEAHI